jgi:hypothetical protein
MNTKQDMTGCVLYSDASRGIYIPQHFALTVDGCALYGYDTDDLAVLQSGPDHPDYWEAWDNILHTAYVLDHTTKTRSGPKTYKLHHDDDLWLVPVDGDFFAQAA